MRELADVRRRRGALLRALLALLLSFALVAQPAAAQNVLRDAETEALLNDIARPLIIAAGLEPHNVKIILLQDPEINAFVAGGQAVYIHSGLIAKADNYNQVQGVIAHEIGHITGGHVVRMAEGASAATGISILSLLLGAAAIAAGAGEAGMGVLMAGQQAAMGKFLAFTRTQEASADAAGVSFLRRAGISGKGMIDFFGKLRREEYRFSPSYTDVDPYSQTHPMTADRQAAIEHDLRSDPAWGKPLDPLFQARFERIKAKLIGYVNDPDDVLRLYPLSDTSLPGHYARAYAYHRSAYPEQAAREVDALLAAAPHDPYFLEIKGQILLESGHPRDAVAPLREAVERSRNDPLIASTLGSALIATEDPAVRTEAKQVLRTAVARDNENPFAWYQLGVVYGQEGDLAHAALATAERYSLEGQPSLALASAENALRGIPEGTPDWIRAQDISMTARVAAEQERRRRH